MAARVGITTLVLLGAAAPAKPADGPLLPVRTTWETVGGVKGLRVELAGDSRPLVEPNGQLIVGPTSCQTELALVTVHGGFDLLISVRNTTGQPQSRPSIALTGIRLDPALTYLDARRVGALRPWNAAGVASQWSSRFNYPDHLYAPVLALFDRRLAVGVSAMYDVLGERHGLSTHWGMEGGQYAGTYRITIEPFLRDLPARLERTNLVPPGRTQRYRVSVRFATPANWLATLEPYRQHFRATYGGVHYRADLTPVWGEPVAQAEFRDAHPRGYNPAWAVDAVGWVRFVDHVLATIVPRGYRRVMIWAPSGLYEHDESYPVEFMTAWSEAMIRTTADLARLRRAGVTVGMWWGQAGQVSAGFNSGRLSVRDLSARGDVEAGDAELSLATARGVQEVGLDAINAMPLWDRYAWVRDVQRRFPALRFITEAMDCDIMHTIAPTFYNWRDHDTPPILTDWLNPGHETWVQLWYNESDPSRFELIRAWGMVPVTMTTPVAHDPRSVVAQGVPGGRRARSVSSRQPGRARQGRDD